MTTMIGETAAITLLTGLPGSGKTLRVVHYCKQAHERGEVVFVSNLNGLKVPHVPFEDPRNWRDLPPGSVLVVDEAQQFFRARRGGEPPEYLTAMETIRHQGVRLVLTTQQPDYLDTHLRGLVGLHEHLVRENGKPATKIFRHNEVMENVRSDRARAKFDNEVWQYPPELFVLYESAQVHTIKPKMTSKMKRGLIGLGVVVLLLGAIAWRAAGITDVGGGEKAGAGGLSTAGDGRGLTLAPASSTGPKFVDADHYAEHHRARIAALPWSAPAYDGRQVKASPMVYCMASGAGDDADGVYRPATCTCTTEQGTPYALPAAECGMVARQGPAYNPYREPERPARPQPAERRQPQVAAAQPAAVVSADQVTGYGDIGQRSTVPAGI